MRIFQYQLSTLNPSLDFQPAFHQQTCRPHFVIYPPSAATSLSVRRSLFASSIFQINRVLVPSPNPRREFSQHAAAPLPPKSILFPQLQLKLVNRLACSRASTPTQDPLAYITKTSNSPSLVQNISSLDVSNSGLVSGT